MHETENLRNQKWLQILNKISVRYHFIYFIDLLII